MKMVRNIGENAALTNRLAPNDFSIDNMLSIKVRRRSDGNEKLGSIRVGTCVSLYDTPGSRLVNENYADVDQEHEQLAHH